MDRLATMVTFAKVVQFASFTAAAEDLGISRTLVSRRIADLEAFLGVKLLNRTTRTVTPTQAGARYSDLCARVLDDIRAGEEAISALNNQIEGEIALLCPIWIGTFDITEAVTEFCTHHPGIDVRLHFAEPSANPHEFITMGYDICIQPNRIRDSTVMIRKIGEVDYILAASPKYIARRGAPASPRDLADHDALMKASDSAWFFADGERVAPKAPAKFSSNSYFSLCTAAVAGLGIVMIPLRIAAADLRTGALVPVLPDAALETRPLYASFAPGRNLPRRVQALIAFLGDWFGSRSADAQKSGYVGRAYAELRSARAKR